jgi:hypothetical protein
MLEPETALILSSRLGMLFDHALNAPSLGFVADARGIVGFGAEEVLKTVLLKLFA